MESASFGIILNIQLPLELNQLWIVGFLSIACLHSKLVWLVNSQHNLYEGFWHRQVLTGHWLWGKHWKKIKDDKNKHSAAFSFSWINIPAFSCLWILGAFQNRPSGDTQNQCIPHYISQYCIVRDGNSFLSILTCKAVSESNLLKFTQANIYSYRCIYTLIDWRWVTVCMCVCMYIYIYIYMYICIYYTMYIFLPLPCHINFSGADSHSGPKCFQKNLDFAFEISKLSMETSAAQGREEGSRGDALTDTFKTRPKNRLWVRCA